MNQDFIIFIDLKSYIFYTLKIIDNLHLFNTHAKMINM